MNPGFYSIMPATVRYDNDIIPNAKVIYTEITALSNKKGFCWATNEYFAKLYQKSEYTISRWISDLAKKEYIKIKIIWDKEKQKNIRYIYLNTIEARLMDKIDEEVKRGIEVAENGNIDLAENSNDHLAEKRKYNNTSIMNNTSIANTNVLAPNSDLNEKIEEIPPLSPEKYKNVKNGGAEKSANAPQSTGNASKTPSNRKKASEPYFNDLTALFFSFCLEKFNNKPSFDGPSPKNLKNIVVALRKRAEEKGVPWTLETAKGRLWNFLSRAFEDKWLKTHWVLKNLDSNKDQIFLQTPVSGPSPEIHTSHNRPPDGSLEALLIARKNYKPLEHKTI